jgi:hypothetical protein
VGGGKGCTSQKEYVYAPMIPPRLDITWPRARCGEAGLKQRTFCMAHRKTMITMGSPYSVWINANEIISSWYLLGAVCVTPPPPWRGVGALFLSWMSSWISSSNTYATC